MQMVDQLSKQYGITNIIQFEDVAEGHPVVRVRNQHAQASIVLHGAHLIDYRRPGEAPVIFTSSDAIYREGQGDPRRYPSVLAMRRQACPWLRADPFLDLAKGGK